MLVFLIYILGSIIAFCCSLHLSYYYNRDNRYFLRCKRESFIEGSPLVVGAFVFSWVGVLVCIFLYLSILFNKFIKYLAYKWFNE